MCFFLKIKYSDIFCFSSELISWFWQKEVFKIRSKILHGCTDVQHLKLHRCLYGCNVTMDVRKYVFSNLYLMFLVAKTKKSICYIFKKTITGKSFLLLTFEKKFRFQSLFCVSYNMSFIVGVELGLKKLPTQTAMLQETHHDFCSFFLAIYLATMLYIYNKHGLKNQQVCCLWEWLCNSYFQLHRPGNPV